MAGLYRAMKWFTNWLKASPAIVYHKDGSRQLVSAFVKESNGNWYCFEYPHVPRDTGFSVPERYIQWVSGAGSVYVWLASKVIRKFPEWVTI